MAEGVDAFAVEVGDGAIGGDIEITGDQLHADHRSRLQPLVAGARRGGRIAAQRALHRFQAEGAQLRGEVFQRGSGEPGEREGCGHFNQARATAHFIWLGHQIFQLGHVERAASGAHA